MRVALSVAIAVTHSLSRSLALSLSRSLAHHLETQIRTSSIRPCQLAADKSPIDRQTVAHICSCLQKDACL